MMETIEFSKTGFASFINGAEMEQPNSLDLDAH